MKVKYIFNKLYEVNPVDRNKNYIEVNYDNEAIINQSFPQVGIKNLRFAREDVAKFYDYIKASNEGVFYAPTFDIELSDNNDTYTVEMYLDLTDGLMISKDGVEASIKLKGSLDWLNDVVDSFTFESVVKNAITPQDIAAKNYILSHTFYIPYVISTKPDSIHAFMGLLTIITVGLALDKEKDYITSFFAPNAANPFTSIPLFVGLAVHVIYAAALIVTVVATIEMFVTSIIQPVKYHGAMLMSDLLTAACLELGLKFESSIFQSKPFNQIALLPEKYVPVANGQSNAFSISGLFSINYIVGGYTSPDASQQQGYPIITGGELFELAKKLINGKILIQQINGARTLVLERRDYNPTTPKYQMPDVRQDWNGFNTKEFFATTIIRFQKDLNDKNCMDQYKGTILSSVVQPITASDPLLTLTKGLREIEVGASRGVRKEALTSPEAIVEGIRSFMADVESVMDGILNGIIDVLNGIVSVVNTLMEAIDIATFGALNWTDISKIDKIQSSSGALSGSDDRHGMLLMENDFVSNPKLLMVDTDNPYYVNGCKVMKLHSANSAIVNALYLWNKFYCIDSWIPVDPSKYPSYSDLQGNGENTPSANLSDKGKHNQYTLWTPALAKSSDKNNVPLAFKEFKLLADDNNFLDVNESDLIADSVGFHYEEGWVDLQYRKNEIYTENLQQSITLPDGN